VNARADQHLLTASTLRGGSRLRPGLLTLAIFLWIPSALPGQSQTDHEAEYRFKAVYLLNFLQFVEWPDSSFANDESSIVLAVLGRDPFESTLDETVQSERIGNHPILVRRFMTLDELAPCHVLFISVSEKQTYRAALKRFNGFPVLTVSDIEGFGDTGGSIGFYMEDQKIRFEINTEALRHANLKVSSKLLRLARVINHP